MINCPNCDHEYDLSQYPDHWGADLRNNRFEFTCEECFVTFTVEVDWEPSFYVEKKKK